MEIAAQIRQNSKEYSDFVTELNKWTREAKVSKDEILENFAQTSDKKKENYKKWEEFDVQKELEDVDYAVEPSKTVDKYKRVKEALLKKELGNEYFKKGFHKKALSEYTASLALDWNEKTLGNRALVWLKLGMYQECITDCSKLIELNSKSIKGFWRRGVARFNLEKFDEAKKDLEYAMVLEPGNKMIREDLQKIKEIKQVEQMRIRPERVKVEIQEIGVSRKDTKDVNSEKLPQNEVIEQEKDMTLKGGLVTEVKTVQHTIQKLEISEEDIKQPSCFMDFERDFKRFKNDKQVLYNYLKKLDPKGFKFLFTNSFQEEHFIFVVDALHDFYLKNQEYEEAIEVIKNLVLIPRFNMIQMFLSKLVKQKISNVFETLRNKTDCKQLEILEKKYKVN